MKRLPILTILTLFHLSQPCDAWIPIKHNWTFPVVENQGRGEEFSGGLVVPPDGSSTFKAEKDTHCWKWDFCGAPSGSTSMWSLFRNGQPPAPAYPPAPANPYYGYQDQDYFFRYQSYQGYNYHGDYIRNHYEAYRGDQRAEKPAPPLNEWYELRGLGNATTVFPAGDHLVGLDAAKDPFYAANRVGTSRFLYRR